MGYALTIEEIRSVIEGEVRGRSGEIADWFSDSDRFFLRAVLPNACDVLPGDQMKPGVAAHMHDELLEVRPYMYRLVCENGAIMAQSGAASEVVVTAHLEPEKLRKEVVLAVTRSLSEEAVKTSFDLIRDSKTRRADLALAMMTMFRRFGHRSSGIVMDVLQRFSSEGDQSSFGLMQAMTSLARDTVDHDTRWRLEELGGGVPARIDDPIRVSRDASEWPGEFDEPAVAPGSKRLVRS